jgi:hypothetical protein
VFFRWLLQPPAFVDREAATFPSVSFYLFMLGPNFVKIFLVGLALRYGLDYRGSRIRYPEELGIFLLTTASRTALGPTQRTIQWVPGTLTLGVKWPGREADHSPPSSAEVKE